MRDTTDVSREARDTLATKHLIQRPFEYQFAALFAAARGRCRSDDRRRG